ncbi:hypothetical protein NA56DRAFT_704611 [Hyaloscypha hepaticicola]|uniref:Cytochrome P450 n=1 Tax=Hyaloscypha hepaticicola TaxID=2082293 RepID=A0A2J6Q1Y8_9HELO|nr:hypothetical protein NA56DRAFT_704611 [Hyaloscypha hepaticicola]
MEFSSASAISFANDLAQSQSHGSRMSTGVVVTTAIAIVLGMSFMVALKMGELDASEPILLKPTFPFIGHLLGMLRWQVGYMQMLSSKIPTHPAFTLRIFSSRIYVICDPSLIQAVYRNTKAFDFG